jgi:hypothetical protein
MHLAASRVIIKGTWPDNPASPPYVYSAIP